MKAHTQYYILKPEKKTLVDRIANVWLPIFFGVITSLSILIGLLLGFALEEIPKINKETDGSGLFFGLSLALVPFAAWLSWAIACLPFIVIGKLCVSELKFIMFKYEYPVNWLVNDL